MTLLLAAPLAAATVWCLARLAVPRLRAVGCGPEGTALGGWHVAMGASMVAMVVWTMTPPVAGTVAALFALGAAWSLARVGRRPSDPARPRARAAYARLAVGSAAMVAMTVPTLAAPATAAATRHAAGHHQHAPAGSALAPPDALVLLLLAGLAVALAGSLVAAAQRTRPRVARLDAGCDAVMAGAMAWMLVLMLPG